MKLFVEFLADKVGQGLEEAHLLLLRRCLH